MYQNAGGFMYTLSSLSSLAAVWCSMYDSDFQLYFLKDIFVLKCSAVFVMIVYQGNTTSYFI